MAININLLPDVKSEEKKKQTLIKKLNLVFILVAVIFLIGAIGVTVMNTILKSNYQKLQSDVVVQERNIDNEIEKETVLVGLKDHLGAITRITVSRLSYSNFLINFAKYIPQSIKITDLTFSSNTQVIINGEAPSYERLAGFVLVLSGDSELEGLTEEQKQNPIFTNVALTSVTKNDTDSTVKFTINFTVKEGAFNE